MHMADALLSPAVGGGMYAASIAAIAYSASKLKKGDLGESKAPLMAVTGAMVFAAQMVNFTIPGTGSSGHISGAILLAALLGPFAGLLTMAAVLVIQCLFFADGGLLALGANIFNIGVIPCLFVYPLITKNILYRSASDKVRRSNVADSRFGGADSQNSAFARRIWAASVVSAIVALQLGAFGIVVQTSASGIVELPFIPFLLLMQPIHLVIGVIEGIVTAAILTFVHAARPQILTPATPSSQTAETERRSIKTIIITFACIAAVCAAVIAIFASANPDGMEWSIIGVTGSDALLPESQGILEYDAPPAGLIGAALVFALAGVAAIIIRAYKSGKRRKNSADKQDS